MASILRVALAVILLCGTPFARAGLLGHTVGLTFEEAQNVLVLIGDPPPPPITTDFGLATVGSGIEFPNALNWIIDVSDTSIHFSFGDTLGDWFTMNSNGFVGFRLHDADGSLPAIIGVSIGFDSHVGLDPSQVSFDGDDILVDMKMWVETGLKLGFSDFCENAPPGLCIPTFTSIRVFQPEFVLDVQFAPAAIPEPASALLVCAGLLGLAARRRRRLRRG